ncbi:MAG: NAD-dependent epimerase/dehydratase family protein [Halapricum sp.]
MSETATDDASTTGDFHVAVTGGAGYIGSRVLNRLQTTHPEWTVSAIDNFYRGDVRRVGGVEIDHVDIRERDRLEAALSGADVVIHLAAVSGVDDCKENADLAQAVNVQGTANVAWFCRKTGAAMAFPFSMAVLGDPEQFPIRIDLPRDPMNWYGRTKVIGERLVESYADGAFPAHLFMKSNLYGDHLVGEKIVTKGTVINFFLGRALAGEPLTVYEPGTQARNYVHVKDVARLYVRSAERFQRQLAAGETGAEAYAVGSDEDPSVMSVAETVQGIATEYGLDVDVELVENPRAGEETLVESFEVETTPVREQLGWEPTHSIEATIRELFERELDS